MKKLLALALLSILAIIAGSGGPAPEPTQKLPIVYHKKYNVSMGFILDTLGSLKHPFDGQKFGKIYKKLKKEFGLSENQIYQPKIASQKDLELVHSKNYLKSLNSSSTISHGIDLKGALSWLPNSWFQDGMLTPMKYATGGTVLAAELALEQGWAINIGGGYHHAQRNAAGGGCFFNDIPLAIEKLHQKNPHLTVLIVDLDAHQGNGHEDYFRDQHATKNQKVFIFDMYNKNEYPKNEDHTAQYIDNPIALDGGQLKSFFFGLREKPVNRRVNDNEYLSKLKTQLPLFIKKLSAVGKKPGIIIYNAGTDPHADDPWGCMNVSTNGIIERDRFVFKIAEAKNIPIAMVTSGGYCPDNHTLVYKCMRQIMIDRGIAPGTLKKST